MKTQLTCQQSSTSTPRTTDQSVALSFDGTLEGFATCVFTAYASHCTVQDIVSDKHIQPRLDQQVVPVPTDMQVALRVQRGIKRTCGNIVWNTISMAFAADCASKNMSIYRFIRYAMKQNHAASCSGCKRKTTCTTPCHSPHVHGVLDEWGNPVVEPVLKLQRHTSNEAEKMRQFIRFQHVDGDLWFAQCNPNASVVPFIMDWFGQRFNTQRFAIYDETHHLAGVSEQGHWQLMSVDSIAPPPHMEDEAIMQDAWRRFYDSLSIDARYNPELRRSFMPMRLWSNITEMQPRGTIHEHQSNSSDATPSYLFTSGINEKPSSNSSSEGT